MRSSAALSSIAVLLSLALAASAPRTAAAQTPGAPVLPPAQPAPPPAQTAPPPAQSPAPPPAQLPAPPPGETPTLPPAQTAPPPGETPALPPAQTAPPPTPKAPPPPPRNGVTVHIESNDPDVSLYRRTKMLDSKRVVNDVVCTAPCGVFVEREMGDDLFLGVNKTPLGERFSLPAGVTDLTLSADVKSRPSRGRKIAGAVLLPLGAVELLVGGIYYAVDWPSQPGIDANALYKGVGIGLMVIGGVMTLTGAILLLTATGDYKVVTPAQPQTSMFRLKDVAFTPPFQTAQGLTPVTAGATWEF